MSNLRDKRQKEFADEWLKWRWGILYLCPRFGKIYTTINILETMPDNIKILIAYPDKEIKKSWDQDFKKRGYNNSNIVYTTHLSIKKYENEKFNLIIIDEIHLLSDAQIDSCFHLFMINKNVLGLTGTLSSWTEKTLYEKLNLKVVGFYPMSLGIKEGIISDYEITIHKIPLDNVQKGMFKKKERTELQQYKALSYVINLKMKTDSFNSTMFLRLSRMRIIQNSIAKRYKTISLLKEFSHERILVFCGLTKIADNLGIPSFHNKMKEKDIFEKFANGEGKHLAVVKIGNSGVTYKPLNKVIINYFDSNSENLAQKIFRCMGIEYNNPDKKADIHIIATTEPEEQKWLNKALEFFDKSKVKYI